MDSAIIMAEYAVETFVANPTLEGLNYLRKTELIEAAKHIGVQVCVTSRKAVIREKVLQGLYANEILKEAAVLDAEPSVVYADSGSKCKDAKSVEAELRLKELELQGKKMDLEMKNIEMKMKPLEFGTCTNKPQVFDVSRNVKLVPKFSEDKVDEFFHHFEKLASSLEWPQTAWPTLIQCSLVGKAQAVYASLSIQDCSEYKTLKGAILRAYELVPEAYRQRFRYSCKGEEQTFVEFAHEKEMHLDRWLVATGVESFDQLKGLTLLDELKRCITPEMRLYLEERRVENVTQAAILLDEYTLTHRGISQGSYSVKGGSSNEPASPKSMRKRDGSWSPTSRRKRIGPCHYCKKDGRVCIADD